jgi:prophage maintenance system killer protein
VAEGAGKDDFSGLEPTIAQAARNAIFFARLICRNQGYPPLEFDSAKLVKILRQSAVYADLADPSSRVIQISASIIAGIIHEQVFTFMSKTASILFVDTFWRLNGFYLDMSYLKVLDRDILLQLEQKKVSQAELQTAVERFLVRYLKRVG